MREFIDNPFQQGFEDDDDVDELDFTDVLRIVEADRLLGPPADLDEDDNDEILIPDSDPDYDENDYDPDYIVENNDGYDSNDSFEFEDLPDYELRSYDSTDNEEDEELDYVTFPVSENHTIDIDTQDTTNKTTNQESSNPPSSEQEPGMEEESWD